MGGEGEWQTCRIEELQAKSDKAIAIGPFGSKMKSDCYVPIGVPVIRGNNISDSLQLVGDFVYVSEEKADELRSCNVFADDLVFPHRGAIGEVGIVPRDSYERYILSTSLMKLTCDRSLVEPLFLLYYFRSSTGKHQLLKHASTVGTPGIGQPLTSLKSIQVPIPPLSEQLAIAHILGTLDDKIELNRRMNETLEAMARALFKSWFVDFDPVRAKMDGRQPAGMDAETAKLFPDRLEHTSIGLSPVGWRVATLPEVIDVNPTRRLASGVDAPYLDMKAMPTAGHRAHRWVMRQFRSGSKFINGDTLLARITPCLENGKTSFVDFLADSQTGWGSTEYIILRPKPPISVEFGYYLARSEGLRMHAIQNMTGTSGRQRVPPSCFDQYLLAVPPAAVAQRFGDSTRLAMGQIRSNSQESQALSSLRDSFLPKLLSGELRVPDAERLLETAR